MNMNSEPLNTDPGPSAAVVGLGMMGRALAAALLRGGYRVTVWNRTPSKADALVVDGATLASSAADALRAGPVTIICVTDDKTVRDVLGSSTPGLAGHLVINLSSGDSVQARATSRWARQHGASYLDGAIMAVPSAIGTSEAAILVSGLEADLVRHQGVLDALGSVTYLGEDPGLSALYDGAGLSMMWSVLNSWLHGVALLNTAGVSAAAFTPFAQQMASGTAGWLTEYAEQVDRASYPADDATLATHSGSMAHLIEESEALGIDAEIPRLFKRLVDRGIAAGHGTSGYPALIDQFRTAQWAR